MVSQIREADTPGPGWSAGQGVTIFHSIVVWASAGVASPPASPRPESPSPASPSAPRRVTPDGREEDDDVLRCFIRRLEPCLRNVPCP